MTGGDRIKAAGTTIRRLVEDVYREWTVTDGPNEFPVVFQKSRKTKGLTVTWQRLYRLNFGTVNGSPVGRRTLIVSPKLLDINDQIMVRELAWAMASQINPSSGIVRARGMITRQLIVALWCPTEWRSRVHYRDRDSVLIWLDWEDERGTDGIKVLRQMIETERVQLIQHRKGTR